MRSPGCSRFVGLASARQRSASSWRIKNDLDFRARVIPHALADQARRNHLAVIDDERVARPQQHRQVSDRAILEFRRGIGPHQQQARGIARNHGAERDAVGRQVKIEQIGAQLSYFRSES